MKIGYALNDWAMKALDDDGRPTFGGSGWARCGLPAKYLAAAGHDVVCGTLVADGLKLGVAEWGPDARPVEPFHYDFDILILQRWMFGDIADRIEAMKANGQVVVNDLDDWFWGLDPRNNAFRATDPTRNVYENRTHYRRVIAASSAITVSTPYLAKRVSEMVGHRCPVYVLENHVEMSAFTPGPVQATRKPVVGWVGALPWRSGDVETMRGVLGPYALSTGSTIHHSGHYGGEDGPKFWEAAGLDSNWVTCSPMVPIDAYPSLFEPIEVGLVPLSDRPFNRAKSWIKGLEYAAAGVPFIAQDLPEYRRLFQLYEVGRLAKKPKDWLRHLEELREPENRMADQVRNLAGVKALDIESGWTKWLDRYLAIVSLNGG